MRTRSARRAEAGFTLVEVTMTMAILGVIGLPLGNLMISYFQNTTETTARLHESHDVQIATAYFAQDVASIGRRTTSDVPLQSVWVGSTAGAPYACGTGTPVVLFAWDEFTPPDSTTPATQKVVEVAYTIRDQDGETRLVRFSCPGPSAPVTSQVLAHGVVPGSVDVTCPSACGIGVPRSVDLALRVEEQGSPDGTYDVVLSGSRRQS